MAKQKVSGENKEARFKRIAAHRTQRLLNDIRLLGNCSNKGIYSYSQGDVSKIFAVIDKELRRIKALFDKPKNMFSL